MTHICSLWEEKVRSAVNDLRSPTREKVIRIAFFGVGGILFVVFDYYFFLRIITLLLSSKAMGGIDIELVGPVLVDQLMAMINLTLFSVLIFSNVVASLSALYLSRDLELLFSAPIPHTQLFIAKFAQATVNSSYMVLVFGLPIYFALGRAFGVGWAYYIEIVLLMIPFVLIPAAIGSLVTMLLLRFFPAKRTYQVMTFLGMIFAGGLIFFFRYLRPETLYQDISTLSQPTFMALIEGLKVPRYPFLPPTWLSHTINELVGLERGVLASNLLFLIAGAAVGVGAVWIVARFIYFTGFSRSFESRGRGSQRRVSNLAVVDRLLSSIGTRRRAVLVKDIKTMFRDPTQWSQLFLIVALIVMYLFSIKSIPASTDFLKDLTGFLNLGLTGFVIAALAVRFIFPSTSLEGQSYWIILSSPLSVRELLWAKFSIYVFPVAVLGEFLVIASNLILGVEPFMMALSTITVLLFSVSLTAMGVGLGAVYPRFSYENAAEIAAGFGGIIYMMLSLAYIGISVVIEARPVYVYFREQLVPGTYEYLSLIVSVVLLVMLNLAVFFVPMQLGIRRLERMEF
jgi:ABC-2 type transport system permease protein